MSTKRQWFGRYRANRCVRHNSPLVQVDHFDGMVCSLGCKHLNTIRAKTLSMSRSQIRDRIRG